MDITVYAFNDSYPMYQFLNGIKSYFSSNEWSGLVFLSISVCLLIGLLTLNKISPLDYLKSFAGPLLVYAAFFIPNVTLNIQDEWKNTGYSVDNIPIIIALPLSFTSTLEKSLLDIVTDHMMPPNMTEFKDFDFFMEAAALNDIVTGKIISNYELIQSIGRYFEDCVLKGISTGYVNEREYYKSSDLLLSTYMPWGIYFTVLSRDGVDTTMTCKNAYTVLNGEVTSEGNSTRTGGMLDQLKATLGNRHSAIGDTYAAINDLGRILFPGFQSTSEQLFSQSLMINGLQTNLASSNPEMMAAMSQAETAQATGITAAAAVYIKKLPTLRAMMKLVIAGLAPFAAAFFLAQWGRAALIWFAALLSVSFWLPIMAIIKATYIASAIEDLHTLVLAGNGLTIPNKMKILAWISETSTVAGTLALAIPATASLLMQMIVPRLAMGAASVVLAAKGAEGFAQRAGMQGLSGAERAAKELEADKINAQHLEQGDIEMLRRGQANRLFGEHTGTAVGSFTGQDHPLWKDTTETDVAGGMDLGMKHDAAHRQSLANSVTSAAQQMKSTTQAALYSAAHGRSVDDVLSRTNEVYQGMTQEERKAFDQTKSLLSGYVKQVGSEKGLSNEQQDALLNQVSSNVRAGAGISFGLKIPFLNNQKFGVDVGGGIEGKSSSSSTEAQKYSDAAKQIEQIALKDGFDQKYTQITGESLGKGSRFSEGHGQHDTSVSSEQFQKQLSTMQQASQTYTEAKTQLDSYDSNVSASGGKTVNTAKLFGATSMNTLQAISDNRGMEPLRNAIMKNQPLPVLRNIASGAFTNVTGRALQGDQQAMRSANDTLHLIAASGQYNRADAEYAQLALASQTGLRGQATVGNVADGSVFADTGSKLSESEGYLDGKGQQMLGGAQSRQEGILLTPVVSVGSIQQKTDKDFLQPPNESAPGYTYEQNTKNLNEISEVRVGRGALGNAAGRIGEKLSAGASENEKMALGMTQDSTQLRAPMNKEVVPPIRGEGSPFPIQRADTPSEKQDQTTRILGQTDRMGRVESDLAASPQVGHGLPEGRTSIPSVRGMLSRTDVEQNSIAETPSPAKTNKQEVSAPEGVLGYGEMTHSSRSPEAAAAIPTVRGMGPRTDVEQNSSVGSIIPEKASKQEVLAPEGGLGQGGKEEKIVIVERKVETISESADVEKSYADMEAGPSQNTDIKPTSMTHGELRGKVDMAPLPHVSPPVAEPETPFPSKIKLPK